MIPLKQMPWHSDAWTLALANAITDPTTLLQRLGLVVVDVDFAPDFPLRVPISFVDRRGHGDAEDPLLRQVLPVTDERHHAPGYSVDPLAESPATRASRIHQ